VSGPVVFVSDLGLRDEFVGVCHLVVAGIAPDVRVVDLSHGVPPHDIQAGAMMLANGMAHAGPDAVALAIVDPGVGTARRAIAVRTAAGPRLVGPDNGLLSLAWAALGGVTQAVEIDPGAVGSTTVSAVFHGRDVFAPAAAHIAAGMPLEQVGQRLDPGILQVLELEDAEAEPGRVHGAVVDVDRFGNIRLSARPADLERAGFRVGTMVEIATTATSIRARRIVAYSDVRPGEYGLLVDAWDWVSVIRYEASAAAGMGVPWGDPVWIALAG
jgi:S-adenosyl-L-methionine hydrolase (adenosine-forming)